MCHVLNLNKSSRVKFYAKNPKSEACEPHSSALPSSILLVFLIPSVCSLYGLAVWSDFVFASMHHVTVCDRASYLTGEDMIHTLIRCQQRHLIALM